MNSELRIHLNSKMFYDEYIEILCISLATFLQVWKLLYKKIIFEKMLWLRNMDQSPKMPKETLPQNFSNAYGDINGCYLATWQLPFCSLKLSETQGEANKGNRKPTWHRKPTWETLNGSGSAPGTRRPGFSCWLCHHITGWACHTSRLVSSFFNRQ